MSEALDTRSIVVERVLPHPIDKVWKALTSSELMARWLMQNDFRAEVGHRFNFRARPIPNMWNGVSDCEVLEVDPPRRLAWRQQPSGDEKPDGIDTVVSWTLTPVEGGVHVRMEHSGFRPKDELGYQAMSGGWPRIVEQLGEVAGGP